MRTKIFLIAVLLSGSVLATARVAYWHRDEVARYVANRYLADSNISLTQLLGLQLNSKQATLAALHIQLPNGQQVLVQDVVTDYQLPSLFSPPVVESLQIGTVQLLEADGGAGATASTSSTSTSELPLMSELLEQLRTFPLHAMSIPNIHLPQRDEPLAINLQQQNGELSVELSSGTLAAALRFSQAAARSVAELVGNITAAHAEVAKLTLSLQPVDTGYTIAGKGLVTINDLSALLGTLQHSLPTLPLQGLNVNWQLTGSVTDRLSVDGSYQFKTQDLQLYGLPAAVPAFDIDAQVKVTGDLLAFSSPLKFSNATADVGLHVKGDYNLNSGAAALQLILPTLTFNEQGPTLKSLVGNLPYPVDLLSGSVGGELSVRLPVSSSNAQPLINIAANVQGVAGYYRDYFFSGASTNFSAKINALNPLSLSAPPVTITVANMDVGLPLSNLALQMQLQMDGNTQALHIASLSSEVLGGTVTAENQQYQLDRERNQFTVRFNGLQLASMLTLADYQGVAAVGGVSGELPLTFTATSVEVHGGSLQGDSPGGRIQYLNAAGVQGNVGLDLVNQALGNYHFETLTSSIDYSESGELLLGMKMQGVNPDMNKGQRINLNLNLSDNIPALLKSLQAARAIEDFLQQQHQQQ
jgi:hypothetical protein